MMPYFSREQVAEIRSRLKVQDVVLPAVEMKKFGAEYKGLCPFHSEKTPSFTLVPAKNFYHCFGCGAHGDGIGFLQNYENLSFGEALARAAAIVGISEGDDRLPQRKQSTTKVARKTGQDEKERKRVYQARDIYFNSVFARGTLAEYYLISRGIRIECLPEETMSQLRFHPGLEYYTQREGGGYQRRGRFPAMVAPMQNSNGKVVAVHITYLNEEGSDKLKIPIDNKAGKFHPAKKVKGLAKGCAIRLGPAAKRMAVAEGIENALSAMTCHPDLITWAAYSLGNIAGDGDPRQKGADHPDKPGARLPTVYPDFKNPGWVPPHQCRELIILAEEDGDVMATRCLINRAARRFQQQYGVRVRLARSAPGKDHNDMLRGL